MDGSSYEPSFFTRDPASLYRPSWFHTNRAAEVNHNSDAIGDCSDEFCTILQRIFTVQTKLCDFQTSRPVMRYRAEEAKYHRNTPSQYLHRICTVVLLHYNFHPGPQEQSSRIGRQISCICTQMNLQCTLFCRDTKL